ncbi:hypothetical protein HU200_062929 [Digitaria exilis]|uniref:Uncharacterized protein n=1 Tax=Digitaria exilis TaxID=1010633 RepID=A0A835A2F1_9POAL|nr:hypothetical protein HU200_062929 [Digitaria exilis]
MNSIDTVFRLGGPSSILASAATVATSSSGSIPRSKVEVLERWEQWQIDSIVSVLSCLLAKNRNRLCLAPPLSTSFTHLTPPLSGTAAFPRLSYLHLKECIVTIRRLQRIIDASPQLATLHIESSFFPGVENVTQDRNRKRSFIGNRAFFNEISEPPIKEQPCYRLVCPTRTAVIFTVYDDSSMAYLEGGLELEAPRLRYFKYHGVLLVDCQLLLKVLGSSNVIQADLHVTQLEKGFHVYYWQYIHGFISAKVLRLKMDSVTDHVANDKQGGQDGLFGSKFFPNLEFLELQGCAINLQAELQQ